MLKWTWLLHASALFSSCIIATLLSLFLYRFTVYSVIITEYKVAGLMTISAKYLQGCMEYINKNFNDKKLVMSEKMCCDFHLPRSKKQRAVLGGQQCGYVTFCIVKKHWQLWCCSSHISCSRPQYCVNFMPQNWPVLIKGGQKLNLSEPGLSCAQPQVCTFKNQWVAWHPGFHKPRFAFPSCWCWC